MSIDVNKIIEESVKDIIDDDKEDALLQENEEHADKKEETDEGFISEKQFNESRDYLKAFVGDGKKS